MAGTSALGILLAVALARPQVPPDAPAPTGTGVHVTSTVTTRLTGAFTVGSAKLRDIERTIEDRRAFDVTIVAAGEGARAARVAYGECTSRLTDSSGEEPPAPLPTSELRYLVAPRQEPRVRELNDKDEPEPADVRADVAAQVEFDAGELLNGSRLGAALAGKPLEPGKEIELPASVARELLLGTLESVTVTRFALTPKPAAADADRIAFAVALVATTKQGSDLAVESTFELAGEIALGREHGRIVALELSGPIRYGGSKEEKGTKIEVRGTGTLLWTYRAEPLPKR